MRHQARLSRTVAGAAIVIGLAGAAAHADYINTFDTSSSPFRYDYGSASSATTVEFNSTYNTAGASGSGSAEFDQTFSGTNSDAAFTGDIFGTVTPVYNISFDLLVDPASASGSGNHAGGYFQVFTRTTNNYNPTYSVYSENLGNPSYTGSTQYGVWEHISIPVDSTVAGSNVRAITFQDYDNDSIVGNVTYYVDNLDIVTTAAAAPEPGSLALLGVFGAAVVARRRNPA